MRRATVLALMILSASCDSPAGPARPQPGLTIVVKGALADTVWAPSVRVVVTLADSTRARLDGVTLQFTELGDADLWLVTDTLTGSFSPAPTNADGRTVFLLRRGYRAGATWLRVSATVDGITWADSVRIVSTPGLPAHVLMPADTTVYQGHSLQWRGTVTDAEGNVRTDVPTFEAASAGISVSGTTVTANAGPSRQLVRAAVGALRDSAWLSIVPQGEISVLVERPYGDGADAGWVYARLALDGSTYVPLLTRATLAGLGGSVDLPAEWMPDGDHVVFRLGDGIGRADLSGAVSMLMTSPGTNFRLHCPMPSADGDWIFAHRTQEGSGGGSVDVWRASVNGGGADGVPMPTGLGGANICPALSPAGRYVAFSANSGFSPSGSCAEHDFTLHVMDLQDSTSRSLGILSFGSVRWSPDGNFIAGSSCGAVFVVSASGAFPRTISAPGAVGSHWPTWSPDGAWIAVERDGPVIDLLNVATGLRLPLGFTGYMRYPSWRP